MKKSVLFFSITLISILSIHTFRWFVDSQIHSLQVIFEKKFHGSFTFGTYNWHGNRLRFENINIKGAIKVSIKSLDISFFHTDSNFSKLAINIDHCQIMVPLDLDLGTVYVPSIHKATNKERSYFPIKFIDRLDISQCFINLVDKEEKSLVTLGINAWENMLSQDNLSLKIGHIAYNNSKIMKNISGNILVNRQENEFPFLLNSKYDTGHHWQAKGTYSHNSHELKFYFKNSGIPLTWMNLFDHKIQIDENTNFAMDLTIRKKSQRFYFTYYAASTNLDFYHSKIGTSPIGPLPLKAKIKGFVDLVSGDIKIDQGQFKLLSLKNPQNSLNLHFTLKNNPAIKQNSPWHLNIYIPQTSCEQTRQILPKSMLGIVKDFKASGYFAFQSSMRLNLSKIEDFAIIKSSGYFSCRFKSENKLFSSKLLKDRIFLKEFDHYLPTPQLYSLFSNHYTSEIPSHLEKAIIASEDNRFYDHNGVDAKALTAAIRANLKHKKFIVGASTITMQLVKNLYFSSKKTIARKIQEMIISLYLETILSKKDILKTYMNVVEFGPNIFGVEQAARVFFAKKAKDLNIIESTYLAISLPSPIKSFENYCSNDLNKESKYAMNKSLARQKSLGFLTSDQWFKAKRTSLDFAINTHFITNRCQISLTRDFNLLNRKRL